MRRPSRPSVSSTNLGTRFLSAASVGHSFANASIISSKIVVRASEFGGPILSIQSARERNARSTAFSKLVVARIKGVSV